jgi:hypothetical protein
VGDRTEAARIVRRAGAGGAVPMEDPAAIAGCLAELAAGRGAEAAAGAAARFHYAALAEELEAELEAAISSTTTVR